MLYNFSRFISFATSLLLLLLLGYWLAACYGIRADAVWLYIILLGAQHSKVLDVKVQLCGNLV